MILNVERRMNARLKDEQELNAASDSLRPTPLPAGGWRRGRRWIRSIATFKNSALALLSHRIVLLNVNDERSRRCCCLRQMEIEDR